MIGVLRRKNYDIFDRRRSFSIVIIISILIICGLPLGELTKGTKIIGIAMAMYLTLNTFLNLISKSKKEKYIMTHFPLLQLFAFGYLL